MKKVAIIVGTRPNYIKAFPVYNAIKDSFDVTMIHTGQHYDDKMFKLFFDELNMEMPDMILSLENRKSASLIGEIMIKLEAAFEKINPDLVIVFGDVNSTLAGALVANKMDIRLAHVEAGLRSFDRSMQEEVNRVLVDQISDYLFITENRAEENLYAEGILNNIHMVGDTMLDTLFKHIDVGIEKEDFILLTIHRQSNVDDALYLQNMMDFLGSLPYEFIFPIHPRTLKNLSELSTNIHTYDAMGYLKFNKMMQKAKLVITDSGGIQSETTALGIPCITFRRNTERPITLEENGGTNTLIEYSKANEDCIRQLVTEKYGKVYEKKSKEIIDEEMSDGKAADRIRDILLSKFYEVL